MLGVQGDKDLLVNPALCKEESEDVTFSKYKCYLSSWAEIGLNLSLFVYPSPVFLTLDTWSPL